MISERNGDLSGPVGAGMDTVGTSSSTQVAASTGLESVRSSMPNQQRTAGDRAVGHSNSGTFRSRSLAEGPTSSASLSREPDAVSSVLHLLLYCCCKEERWLASLFLSCPRCRVYVG